MSTDHKGVQGPRVRSRCRALLSALAAGRLTSSESQEAVAAAVRDLGWPALLEAAEHHGVQGHLYAEVQTWPSADEGVIEQLRTTYESMVASHLGSLAELRFLSDALGADVPWLVFKGPVLSELVYRRPGLRSYSDLDILVWRPDFELALNRLERAGYVLVDRNWELIREELRGQLHFRSPRDTFVDLHWHLLNRRTVRRGFDVDMDGIFTRAITVALPTGDVRTMSPSDTFVHLCVHGALAGGHRLRWLKDVDEAMRSLGIGWEGVIERAHQWRARVIVAYMLRRCQRQFGSAVPDGVVEALLPHPVSRGVVNMTELVGASAFVRRPDVLVPQLLRDRPTDAIRALRDRLRRWVRGFGADWPTEEGVLFPRGDAADRASYLLQVVEGSPGG